MQHMSNRKTYVAEVILGGPLEVVLRNKCVGAHGTTSKGAL